MPPEIPDNLQPPAGAELVMKLSARGYQIYVCKHAAYAGGKPEWALKMPLAELFDEQGAVVGTHYAGPTWKLNDGSEVTGKMLARADAPAKGAIPWLLIAVGNDSGQGALKDVTCIQRINTSGGVAPESCSEEELGKEAKVAYEAEYWFYAGKR